MYYPNKIVEHVSLSSGPPMRLLANRRSIQKGKGKHYVLRRRSLGRRSRKPDEERSGGNIAGAESLGDRFSGSQRCSLGIAAGCLLKSEGEKFRPSAKP
jgi:hypothetical protein